MEINIKKRDGSFEKLMVDKTKKVVAFACQNIEGCSPEELELDAKLQFRDGMTTKEIQKTLIQTAIEKVIYTEDDGYGNLVKKININWQYVASRLLIYDLYKESAINRNYTHF